MHDGQHAKARRLLFDAAKMSRTTLPTPDRFDDLDAFNAALARELLADHHKITDMPVDEQATRGAALIFHLSDGDARCG